jgi:Tfp pilus assembly protein PilF
LNTPTDWVSAIAILASGLILGAMIIYFFRRRTAPMQVDGERRDLEAKRDALVQQIRAEADPAERTRLELEAARVLRQLAAVEERRPRPSPSSPQPGEPVKRANPALTGFAWGVGSVVVLGALGYFVMKSATDRQQNQSPTGGMQARQQQQPQADPALLALEASVQKQPDNLDMRIDLARAYLERENLMGVFEQTQYVLAKSPEDSRALTYQALVRMAMGESDSANDMLKRALRSDPNFLDAYVTTAWVQTQEGKVAEAEKTMQEAMRRHPQEKQRLQEVLDSMKSHRSMASQQPAAPQGEMPAGHPPIEGATPAPAAPAQTSSSKEAIRISLELDASARGKNGVIYVIARPAGAPSGPPLAVKRVAVNSLPTTIDLSSADSMMGQPLPPKVRVEARLDTDGDAATKNPSDPFAFSDQVGAGASIKLTLK